MNGLILKTEHLLLCLPGGQQRAALQRLPHFPGWLSDEGQPEGYGCLAALYENEPAGAMGLFSCTLGGRRLCGLYYGLLPAFWGRGLAAEGAARCLSYAFEALRSPFVVAPVPASDLPARRVAERLGMKIEGEQGGKLVYCLHAPGDTGTI
ncbi:GNAT family N-acetyltransferase [Harryflintia acetispora]|uniref:Acetyltransferase (GNAT) family protein n=1 Tax=Harryflintia acetispora TaxID=1849041 RepID=A0A9X8Y8S4_9FIRM|nr:GNAT family N-acetyltransferase [Harryflintia acetispora]TCL44006.1 acetyltransferase (GNAT) family protein [Harryflintia acetispora]